MTIASTSARGQGRGNHRLITLLCLRNGNLSAYERYTRTGTSTEHLIIVHRESYLGPNHTIHHTKFVGNLDAKSIYTS
jgi:hypothetical protein